jgi:hypothetical protein
LLDFSDQWQPWVWVGLGSLVQTPRLALVAMQHLGSKVIHPEISISVSAFEVANTNDRSKRRVRLTRRKVETERLTDARAYSWQRVSLNKPTVPVGSPPGSYPGLNFISFDARIDPTNSTIDPFLSTTEDAANSYSAPSIGVPA